MRLAYACSSCKDVFKATEQNFYPCHLKQAQKNPALTVLPQCKVCSKEYQAKYLEKLKSKGVSRSQKTSKKELWNKAGTLYIVGADVPNAPFKIGVVSGTDTKKRLAALQTSHWIELKEVWRSLMLPQAFSIEKKLHHYFESKKVRGEWFNLDSRDLALLPQLIETFKEQNENPCYT